MAAVAVGIDFFSADPKAVHLGINDKILFISTAFPSILCISTHLKLGRKPRWTPRHSKRLTVWKQLKCITFA